MADFTFLTAGGDTTNNTNSTTASISPTADGQIVLIGQAQVGNAAMTASTAPSGNSLTWALVGSDVIYDNATDFFVVSLWKGTGTATAGTVTITQGATSGNKAGRCWAIVQLVGCNTTTPNAQNLATGSSSVAGTSGSATLGSTPTHTVLGFVAHGVNANAVAGTNFTVDGGGGHTNPANHMTEESKTASLDTTVNATFASSVWSVIGIELNVTASGFSYHGPILTGVG